MGLINSLPPSSNYNPHCCKLGSPSYLSVQSILDRARIPSKQPQQERFSRVLASPSPTNLKSAHTSTKEEQTPNPGPVEYVESSVAMTATHFQHASLAGLPPIYSSTLAQSHSVAVSSANGSTPPRDAFTTNLAQLLPQMIAARPRGVGDDEDAASFRKSVQANAAVSAGLSGSYPSRVGSLDSSEDVDDDVMFGFGEGEESSGGDVIEGTKLVLEDNNDASNMPAAHSHHQPPAPNTTRFTLPEPSLEVEAIRAKEQEDLKLIFEKTPIDPVSHQTSRQKPGHKSSLSVLLKNNAALDNPFSDYSFFVCIIWFAGCFFIFLAA